MAEEVKKETILVVDDKSENITVVFGILKDYYTVKVANNGMKALAIAEEEKPDLILLDIMMPEMDGYEVCSRLKENLRTSRIPVIFVTSKGLEVDETKGLDLGAVDYITKPISPSILKSRIKTHLALYNQNRELEVMVRERTVELEETRLEIIRKLGIAGEYKDNETGLHVLRMSRYAKEIAHEYGLDQSDIELLFNVSPMHDIGKIGIPDKILLKPEKLDDEEWEIMKTHTVIGAKIITENNKSRLLHAAYLSALTHHERWDGSGYPEGLKGNEIPLFGRILAIADVFDALTSVRPYKGAWTNLDAKEFISNEKGAQFDPALVDAFLRAFPRIEQIQKDYN